MNPVKRRTARLAALAAALTLPAAVLAGPAHAAPRTAPQAAPPAAPAEKAKKLTTCSVNGIPVTGAVVHGTPGPDRITCESVDAFTVVDGLGGDDFIDVGIVGPYGRVNGGFGNDRIFVHLNLGVVDGGPGLDSCVILQGNRALDCP
ncbi:MULTISPECIES: hypothetical protein [Streptomyces]|uniref:Secreted protein n=1 Tax=Streptomyces luteosporeus TaxID=173856 RepID=A0ABN3U390_9ACTN